MWYCDNLALIQGEVIFLKIGITNWPSSNNYQFSSLNRQDRPPKGSVPDNRYQSFFYTIINCNGKFLVKRIYYKLISNGTEELYENL